MSYFCFSFLFFLFFFCLSICRFTTGCFCTNMSLVMGSITLPDLVTTDGWIKRLWAFSGTKVLPIDALILASKSCTVVNGYGNSLTRCCFNFLFSPSKMITSPLFSSLRGASLGNFNMNSLFLRLSLLALMFVPAQLPHPGRLRLMFCGCEFLIYKHFAYIKLD